MFALLRSLRVWGVAVLAALVCAPLQAASVPSPRDELLRFVPDDVGFCVIVQNLRDNGKALRDSPFAQQFRKSAVGVKAEQNPDIRRLLDMDEELKEKFGIGWEGLQNDILGDAVVFAYRPGRNPDEGEELMLIRARQAKVLADLVDRVNKVQKPKALTESNYKGVKYFNRVDEHETGYYFLRGPILVYSSKEEMVKRAIDLDLAAPPDAPPALATVLQKLGAERAMLSLIVKPRAFDAAIAAKKAKNDLILETLLVYWKAVDTVVVSLTLDRDATLAVGVAGRSADLPAPARRFFSELSRPSELWRQIPDDALFAVGGRVDFEALTEMVGAFLTEENRKQFRTRLKGTLTELANMDLVKDVLPHIGPDWAIWVTAPTDKGHLLPLAILALRVGVGDKAAPVDKALLKQVDSFALLARVAHGQFFPDKPLLQKKETFGKQEVDYLESDALPAGIRPAFALKDGFLLLASAPEQIGRFAAPTATTPDGPATLLRVSFKAWRGYIESQGDGLSKLIAEKNPSMSRDDARNHLDTVLSVLKFVDRLEVRHEAGAGYGVLSIVIQTAQPLRK
jgi:hypothetical protein